MRIENVKKLCDIIIVNWNAGTQLKDCLDSIAQHGPPNVHSVIVVDNASADGSAEGLDNISLPLTIIRNAENRGFAAACNQGAKNSKADYLLFLNPDTCLFSDSLIRPIHFMEQPGNEKIGICGIQLIDEKGRVARSCARFPTPGMFFSKMLGLDRLFPHVFPAHNMAKWDHMNSQKVDQIMGAFFLVRRSLFETVGGFDERFFVYFEEVDFSFRIHHAGWRSFYLADAQAYHKGGGTSEQAKAIRLFYSLRSRILYGYKHFSLVSAAALMLGTLFFEPFTRLALAAFNRSSLQAEETLKAYNMLWRAAPELFISVTGSDRQ